MKATRIVILIPLAIVLAAVSIAQLPTEAQGPSKQTQVVGYWMDSSTGLMWTAKDNGQEVSPRQAKRYCKNLRLAGYADWRLPTLAELVSIFDKHAESPGENPRSRWHEAEPMTYHVKGDLFLTGRQWSSNRDWFAWYFDFRDGQGYSDDPWIAHERALCVRP
jgi:hypothetical protein